MNRKLPDVQTGFRKGRRTRDQIVNIRWIIKKAREFQKNIYFCFIDYAETFDCVDHNKLHIKKKRHYLPTKVHIVKGMVFPVVMYGCESWTIKKAEHKRIDAFQLWY